MATEFSKIIPLLGDSVYLEPAHKVAIRLYENILCRLIPNLPQATL